MASKFFWLFLLLVHLATTHGVCPKTCTCPTDEKGRRTVQCVKGNMEGPIPIHEMDRQTEVLIISAPDEDSSNMLTIGPIFQQFSELQELHITRSNLPAIGRHSFWGVPTLRVLNLTQNNISSVLDDNFRGLANLLELHLDDNRIETMPSGSFRHLADLKILTLANNRLPELVPRLFLMLGKLKELDLSGNEIGDLVPEVFRDVQELSALRCRACRLKSINTQLYHLLPHLQELDLSDNHIKYIPQDEFRDLKKLKILKLAGNQLPVVLENTFEVQTELLVLSFARNRLAKVTNTAFTNLYSLQELDLSYNKLDRLELMTFQPIMESLQVLDVSGNSIPISELKYIIQALPNLKGLGIGDMNLTDLPLGIFVFNENLQSLNLSGNLFSTFGVQILSPVPRLNILDLSRNRLKGVEDRLMYRFENIRRVSLHGNPWSCDLCHISPILARINKTNIGKELQKLKCSTPTSLEGRTFDSLKAPSLGWCSAGLNYMEGGHDAASTSYNYNFLSEDGRLSIIAAIAAVLLVILTVSALIAGMCYSKHHTAQYYTNEEKRDPKHEFENPASIFGENGEISFKFPLLDSTELNQTKSQIVNISTIDEIKKDSLSSSQVQTTTT